MYIYNFLPMERLGSDILGTVSTAFTVAGVVFDAFRLCLCRGGG